MKYFFCTGFISVCFAGCISFTFFREVHIVRLAPRQELQGDGAGLRDLYLGQERVKVRTVLAQDQEMSCAQSFHETQKGKQEDQEDHQH